MLKIILSVLSVERIKHLEIFLGVLDMYNRVKMSLKSRFMAVQLAVSMLSAKRDMLTKQCAYMFFSSPAPVPLAFFSYFIQSPIHFYTWLELDFLVSCCCIIFPKIPFIGAVYLSICSPDITHMCCRFWRASLTSILRQIFSKNRNKHCVGMTWLGIANGYGKN